MHQGRYVSLCVPMAPMVKILSVLVLARSREMLPPISPTLVSTTAPMVLMLKVANALLTALAATTPTL